MKSTLPIVVAVIGLALLAFSFLSGFLFPVEKAWTAEKSQAMRQVSNGVRDISLKIIMAEEAQSAVKGDELQQLKMERGLLEEKQTAMQAEFEKAATSPDRIATWLRWSGILAAVGGIAAHRALNDE